MNIKEQLIFAGSILATIVVLTALSLIGVNYFQQKTCSAQFSEYNSTYSFLGGCKVEWNGKMTTVSIIRDIK